MSKGLPIFKLANKSIKGWFPTSKGDKNSLIPFIGTNEEKFLYYVEYNPEIYHIERADISEEFASKYGLEISSFIPIVIPYEYQGKTHDYYPDFILYIRGGKTVVVEVGDKEQKENILALTKAIKAIEYCEEKGWDYWLVKSNNIISKIKYDNLVMLKSYDKAFYYNVSIQKNILQLLDESYQSIDSIAKKLKGKHSDLEIELNLYWSINNLVKIGMLNFDIEIERLTRESHFNVLSPGASPLVVSPIHVSYEEIFSAISDKQFSASEVENNEINDTRITHLDPESLPEEVRDSFLRKRSAVLSVLSCDNIESKSDIAKRYGLSRSHLYWLVNQYLLYGEEALVPYRSYNGSKTFICEEVRLVIEKIIKKHPRWNAMQLFESEDLKKNIMTLSKIENAVYVRPSYYQIYRFMDNFKKGIIISDNSKEHVRGKKKATIVGQWVRSIAHRLDQVQVDCHWIDIKIVTKDKKHVAGRIWATVIIDVKTSMINGYYLSLKTPMEEDYMLALKCCIEDKEQITSRFSCKNEWPCSGIPRRILSDNGKIFISKRSTEVVAKRLGIVEEIAPPYAPEVKGTVEALFKWVVEKLVSRLPGFTKDRDSDTIRKEALQAGITLEDFEDLFVNAIVDSYNIEWDDLRGQTPLNLWKAEDQSNDLITPRWIGSKDELKLLLMKEDKSRKVDRHGISFLGRLYQNITMLDSLIGKRVNIRYDKRDISVIYVYLDDGKYYCEAYCEELRGCRLSIWEDQIQKQDTKAEKNYYNAISSNNLGFTISKKRKNKREKVNERQAQYQEQKRIFSEQDIHIKEVNEVLSSTRGDKKQDDQVVIPVSVTPKTFIKKLEIREI